MTWIALKMLTGDPAKFLGIVFGVTFASLLMSHQVSIFCGIMGRTTSVINDVHEPDFWVTDEYTRYIDEAPPLSDMDLQRVRGVPGVEWAVRLFKNNVRARMADGTYRLAMLIGLDDATLVGAPREMILGTLADLKQPDAVVVDKAGYEYMFPGQPVTLGRVLEMNDRRAVLVGVCKATAPFQSMPILYTRYSQATQFAPPERRVMTYVLAAAERGVTPDEACRRVTQSTGLKAVTRDEFRWMTINYYLGSTGIPVNFGITVGLGFFVGVAIAGQTFYLFTIENLKQFGALKAMGLGNLRIVFMILVQAAVVGVLGYGFGMGLTAAFFEVTKNVTALQGFYLPWQVMAGTAVAVSVIVVLASLLSIQRVMVLEPAEVFR